MNRPKLGVSACLLGHSVRYNGDHKKNDWIVNRLSQFVTFSPVCPEVAMGLSTPRPAMRLISTHSGEVRMVTSNDRKDYTDRAKETSARLLRSGRNDRSIQNDQNLQSEPDWDGFILKKDSPSCGLERVKVYPPSTIPMKVGEGFFAKALREKFPTLPIIEEGRLSDPEQREHFVTQLFAYSRLKSVKPDFAEIQTFHRNYKLILMEHSPQHDQKLGRIVGNGDQISPQALLDDYIPIFMDALRIPASPQKRMNVMQHIMGYFKKVINSTEKKQVLESILEYRKGLLPFAAPVNLLYYLVRRFSVKYLEDQFFFAPYPKALGSRNSWLD